jgi:hypothetical protein
MLIPRAIVQSPHRHIYRCAPGLWRLHHHGRPHPPRVGGQQQQQQQENQQEQQEKEQKEGQNAALPAPGAGEPITLDVSGGQSTVRLAQLGPLVVNADGTTGRVNNWAEMTAMERETTLRLLNKRNKARLDALKAKDGQSGTGDAGGSASSGRP